MIAQPPLPFTLTDGVIHGLVRQSTIPGTEHTMDAVTADLEAWLAEREHDEADDMDWIACPWCYGLSVEAAHYTSDQPGHTDVDRYHCPDCGQGWTE